MHHKKIIIFSILFLLLAEISVVNASSTFSALDFNQGRFFTKKQAKEFLKRSLPQNIVEEKITFLVNEDFANTYPDWKLGAADIIEYVNFILAKNTKKRLTIASYLTYPVPAGQNLYDIIRSLQNKKQYLVPNGGKGSLFGGLQVVYYIGQRSIELQQHGGGIDGKIFGKNYGFVFVAEQSAEFRYTVLFGKKFFQTYEAWPRSWQRNLYVPLHEIGHALGLAYYDQYNYNFLTDNTKVSPLLSLQEYKSETRYPLDPMTLTSATADPAESALDFIFSDLNAALINQNLTRSFTGKQLFSLMARRVVLRVKDENGEPVSGALAKVFGIEVDRSVLRQTVRTNKKGEVKIKAPLGWVTENGRQEDYDVVFAEIVKVSKNRKKGAGYIDTLMLQDAFVSQEKDTYFMDIVIR